MHAPFRLRPMGCNPVLITVSAILAGIADIDISHNCQKPIVRGPNGLSRSQSRGTTRQSPQPNSFLDEIGPASADAELTIAHGNNPRVRDKNSERATLLPRFLNKNGGFRLARQVLN